eukprot:GABV01000199.1.p1 GENE.GABV01000199.1~~GABV01000199.1.p1  ORF type:complete len:350 (+),score=99.27 GABV01000199.1:447-1496(+)
MKGSDVWNSVRVNSEFSSGTYYYCVKIDQTKAGMIALGISEYDLRIAGPWLGAEGNSMSWISGDGSIWHRGSRATPPRRNAAMAKPLRTGDVVAMFLDTNDKTLSFAVNGVVVGVNALSNLPSNMVPTVSLFSAGDRITLCGFRVGNRAKTAFPREWNSSDVEVLKTVQGHRVEVDISRQACAPFLLQPGMIVSCEPEPSEDETPRPWTVVGVGVNPESFRNILWCWDEDGGGLRGITRDRAFKTLKTIQASVPSGNNRRLLKPILAQCQWVEEQQPSSPSAAGASKTSSSSSSKSTAAPAPPPAGISADAAAAAPVPPGPPQLNPSPSVVDAHDGSSSEEIMGFGLFD